MITKDTKLRVWCQKVLPLVYDDSLSYYELLCKVVKHINTHTESINALIDLYSEFSDHINEIVEQMLEDGDLNPIIAETLGQLVASPYDETANYNIGDYCIEDGKLYCANDETTGTFDPTKWDETQIAPELKDLKDRLSNIEAGYVQDIVYSPTAHELRKTVEGTETGIIDVDDTPRNLSNALASSKAVYDLKNDVEETYVSEVAYSPSLHALRKTVSNVETGIIDVDDEPRDLSNALASSKAVFDLREESEEKYVTNVAYSPGSHSLRKTINGEETGVIDVDDIPRDISNALASSKNTFNIQKMISVPITYYTADTDLNVGDYRIINNELLRMTNNITEGNQIIIGTNAEIVRLGNVIQYDLRNTQSLVNLEATINNEIFFKLFKFVAYQIVFTVSTELATGRPLFNNFVAPHINTNGAFGVTFYSSVGSPRKAHYSILNNKGTLITDEVFEVGSYRGTIVYVI